MNIIIKYNNKKQNGIILLNIGLRRRAAQCTYTIYILFVCMCACCCVCLLLVCGVFHQCLQQHVILFYIYAIENKMRVEYMKQIKRS